MMVLASSGSSTYSCCTYQILLTGKLIAQGTRWEGRWQHLQRLTSRRP